MYLQQGCFNERKNIVALIKFETILLKDSNSSKVAVSKSH